MLSEEDARRVLRTRLLPDAKIEHLSTEPVRVGRGGNTACAFRHRFLQVGRGNRDVFHKVLKADHLRYRDHQGRDARIKDPEIAVAQFVLNGGVIPIPTTEPVACYKSHLLYEYLPARAVKTDLDTTLALVQYAARINSVSDRLAAEKSGLQTELFFAARNTRKNVLELLDDEIITEMLGRERVESARRLYSGWIVDQHHLPNVFSHGDLHSHNASQLEGELIIYDWGSAGLYPAGFDIAESITHAHMLGIPGAESGQLLTLYQDELLQSGIRLDEIREGLIFGILKWLLPNHLRNIRRFHTAGDLRRVHQRTSISMACLDVAHDVAG